MKAETIVRAIENGKLNDAREGIDDIMINKIADSLEEKKQSLGDALVGVCEDCEETEEIEEGSKEEYEAFFKKAMEKFGISSPADLKSEEEKKKFFDYVDKNYKGEKNEESEDELEEMGNRPSREEMRAKRAAMRAKEGGGGSNPAHVPGSPQHSLAQRKAKKKIATMDKRRKTPGRQG